MFWCSGDVFCSAIDRLTKDGLRENVELVSMFSQAFCSKHFEEKWLNRTGQIVRLKDGAIPTIFLLPTHLQPKPILYRSSKTSNRSLELENDSAEHIFPQDAVTILQPKPILYRSSKTSNLSLELENNSAEHIFPQDAVTILQDHNYNCDNPSVYKKRTLDMQDRIDVLQKRLKNTQARERRARRTCQTLIDSLKEQNYLNNELEEKLRVHKDIPCELFKKPHGQYTEEQRYFALTLHMYSPKAYEYFSKNVQLPAPRTLTKWLEKIKAEPGISLCMLQSLKENVEKFPEQYTHCCVMVDAMAIRKQVIYEKHSQKLVGYVDLGTGKDEDEEVGKEVLVVMAVGFKQKWSV
ncbi:uncharacterized protein LOC130010700 [Patella vulgata]|uniref:uncharacterized protein LOC130010700 n=1 Tax=Patella vulgata TaxID=6465 RepID=UPI0024A89824|nr:uncharacterized protein LOC130010700 [Patella vulgata]